MSARPLHVAWVSLTILVLCSAGEPLQAQVKKLQMRPTASVNGKDVYQMYCAHCHGDDLKGHGPEAAVLRIPPADLTTIAVRNDGKFETGQLEDKINRWKQLPRTFTEAALKKRALETGENIQDVPVMPSFGPIFGKHYPQEVRDRQIRMANLIRYVKSQQQKPESVPK